MIRDIEYSFCPTYKPINPTDYNTVNVNILQCEDNLNKQNLDESHKQLTYKIPNFCFEDFSADKIKTEPAEIISIEKLESTWKDTYIIGFDKTFNYSPGDSIGILVPNSDDLVDEIMVHCGFANEICEIERIGTGKFRFKGYLRDLIKFKIDLTSIPKKIHLLSLSKNSTKRDHVEYLCSREGFKDYMRIGVNWNNILDILVFFDCKPSIEDLVKYSEFIKPRYYSLINNRKDNGEIILGSIQKHFSNEILYGHVSSFIRNINNRLLELEIKTSSMPSDLHIPIGHNLRKTQLLNNAEFKNLVCFCTGTGIAPFLSFYNNRKENQNFHLIYGFRNDEDDLSKVFDIKCPVTRAKSSQGNYVTDYVHIIEDYIKDCKVFICGNIGMQNQVFTKISNLYPILVEEERILFDSWQ